MCRIDTAVMFDRETRPVITIDNEVLFPPAFAEFARDHEEDIRARLANYTLFLQIVQITIKRK